jgi:signal transduction histidine kinase
MKRLLQAINVLPDAVLLVQGNGLLVGSNPAARELFSSDLEKGGLLSDLVSDPPEKVLRSLNLWSSSRQFVPASLRLIKDGQTLVIRCDGAAVEPATRDLPSLLLLRCVTRSDSVATKLFLQLNEKIDHLSKQMAEQKARDHERLSALATTAAVFAHEIANPLNGIGMSVQLVAASLDGQEVNPLLRESIVEANKEIARLSALLREFRTFARTQFINLQSTDVSLLVKEILSLEMLLFSAAKVQVKTDFACLPPIMLDRDKMKQAFLNIVKNAVEAMPGGGCVTIKGYVSESDAVILEVTDTGVGIAEGIDVFEIFRTTKPNGTGLGLTVASQIISAHKGMISYRSEPARGTTFKVSLPLNR